MNRMLKMMAVFVSLLALQGCATYSGGKWLSPVIQGDTAKIQSFIDDGDHLTYRDKYGLTPLHTAAKNGDASIVKLLLDAGADVHAIAGTFKATPLSWAMSTQSNDRAEVINLLLAQGADIYAKDYSGATPLENAFLNANNVKALLLAGADPLKTGDSDVSIRDSYKKKLDLYGKYEFFQMKITASIAALDEFSAPHMSLKRCEDLSLVQQSRCYTTHIKKYADSITADTARERMASSKVLVAQVKKENAAKARLERARLAKIAKARKAKAAAKQKRFAQQACRLKSSEWLYLSKSCKKGLADGQGEAINEAKNLKFVGQFKQGKRTQGELYVDNQLKYDGSLEDGRPHGSGTCIQDGEPEECKYYKGKRTDVLYKQRLEFAKQRELMASSEARINESLASSEQRMNERLSDIQSQSANNQQAQGNTMGDYATDALKKKAADKVADAIFDRLF